MGEILGQRVAYYRERAHLTQPELAARLKALGFNLSRVTIANIEAAGRPESNARNRTRANNATMVDVLALAAALDVPVPLLVVPLGQAEEVQFGTTIVDSHLMVDWLAGDEALLGKPSPSQAEGRSNPNLLGSLPVGNYARWRENSQTLRLFRDLRQLQGKVHEAESLIGLLGDRAGDALIEAKRALDGALRVLDRHHHYMRDAGLEQPMVPEDWAVRIAQLQLNETGEK